MPIRVVPVVHNHILVVPSASRNSTKAWASVRKCHPTYSCGPCSRVAEAARASGAPELDRDDEAADRCQRNPRHVQHRIPGKRDGNAASTGRDADGADPATAVVE